MLRTEATKVWNMGKDWEPTAIDENPETEIEGEKGYGELRFPIFEIGKNMEEKASEQEDDEKYINAKYMEL